MAVTEHEPFDLAIIGTGGAAFSAAIRGHELGAERIALIESGVLGGTCVNVGCVPSKTLLAAARAHHDARSHPFAGTPHSKGEIDLGALIEQKRVLVDEMRQGKYLDLAQLYGFELIEGVAQFVSPVLLDVDGATVQAHRYVIATGAEPAVPELPGLSDVDFLTSTSAMELREVPEHLIVIGGGFVGLEQAQLFRRLGAGVTVIGRFAPHTEPELSAVLASVFRDEGIGLTSARATSVEHADAITVHLDDGSSVTGSHLLLAAGRRPCTAALNLDAAGVEIDVHGAIITDDRQRTSSKNVYAAGDVTDSPQFVYLAAAQGAVAAENAIADLGTSIDLTGLPSVIFTDPQVGSAGLTEAQATAAGIDVDSRTIGLAKVPRAVVEHDTRGAVKLVADKASRKILGVHAVGPNAGDLMLAGTYAITSGMTVSEMASTWAPYLTNAEGLRLAARSFDHDIGRLSCCA